MYKILSPLYRFFFLKSGNCWVTCPRSHSRKVTAVLISYQLDSKPYPLPTTSCCLLFQCLKKKKSMLSVSALNHAKLHCTAQILLLTLWPYILSLFRCAASSAFLSALPVSQTSPISTWLSSFSFLSGPSLLLDKMAPAEAIPYTPSIPCRDWKSACPLYYSNSWHWKGPRDVLFPFLSAFQHVSLLQVCDPHSCSYYRNSI